MIFSCACIRTTEAKIYIRILRIYIPIRGNISREFASEEAWRAKERLKKRGERKRRGKGGRGNANTKTEKDGGRW